MGSELVYTDHALEQMTARNYTSVDIEAAIASPTRGTYAPEKRDRMEHYGLTADGRLINVVTTKDESVVITVIEQ